MTTNDNLNTFNEITSSGMERMTALGELNMKVAERVAARQLDLMSLCMEQSAKFMRLATEARGYGDLYRAQVDFAKETTEQLLAESKTNMQVATEARDEYRGWYETTVAEVRKSPASAGAGA